MFEVENSKNIGIEMDKADADSGTGGDTGAEHRHEQFRYNSKNLYNISVPKALTLQTTLTKIKNLFFHIYILNVPKNFSCTFPRFI